MPHRLYSLSCLASFPGLAGIGARTSACSEIVDEDDLADAAAKVKAFRSAQKGLDSGLNSDKNRDSSSK